MSNNLKSSNILAMLLLLFANVSDILTTIIGLQLGGYEANPIGRFMLQNFGYEGLWSLKFAYLSIYTLIVAKSDEKSRLKNTLIGSAIVFGVVIWNIIMILTKL